MIKPRLIKVRFCISGILTKIQCIEGCYLFGPYLIATPRPPMVGSLNTEGKIPNTTIPYLVFEFKGRTEDKKSGKVYLMELTEINLDYNN